MRFEIGPSDVLSWLNMSVSFSTDEDLIVHLEEVAEEVLKILNVFYKEVQDVKITMDVNYSISKELDLMPDVFKELLLNLKYEPKKTSKNEFRKFEITRKRNIISLVSLRDLTDITDFSVYVSVENIVINIAKFKAELVNSLYFYAKEYIALHYNIVKSKDEYYFENNAKFYESLLK